MNPWNPDVRQNALSRRRFLLHSGGLATGCGLAGWAVLSAYAEPQIAARIEEPAPEHPLLPAIKLLNESLAELESITDYEATLVKQERVGRQLLTGKLELKYRESPLSVYLKFVEPHAGREVIYRPDQNGGKLLVHDVGLASLVGTVQLDPLGKLALEESRHPVSAIGLKRMVELLREQWAKESKLPDVTVNFYPNAKIGTLACQVIEVSHAKPQPEVVYQMTRLYLDAATKLPVRVQNYEFATRRGSKPELVEDYFYMNLRTNIGLTDIDFDSRNPKYKF